LIRGGGFETGAGVAIESVGGAGMDGAPTAIAAKPVRQCGHSIQRPTRFTGTDTVALHCGQSPTGTCAVDTFGEGGTAPDFGLPEGGCCWPNSVLLPSRVGICSHSPQWGQGPVVPAVCGGALITDRQRGQANRIMGQSLVGSDGLLAQPLPRQQWLTPKPRLGGMLTRRTADFRGLSPFLAVQAARARRVLQGAAAYAPKVS
jgi:hypothetical protein